MADEDVRAAIREAIGKDSRILTEPEPEIRIDSFDSMSTSYNVKVPCKSEDYIGVSYALVENVYASFMEHSIEMGSSMMGMRGGGPGGMGGAGAQAAGAPAEPRVTEKDGPQTPVRLFLRNMLLAVFALSAVVYLVTRNDPSGLAYKMVRGQWKHTFNVVTVTTLLMMISMTVTAYTVLRIILNCLSRRLSPRGKTICQMINSASHYIGTIILILFALSMFGVNTTTLLGGAGIIALMFTFGANSLISDVLAGLFVIFEGDIMVGDMVQIGNARGRITDISMRTIRLMDEDTQEITVINNSRISDIVNLTRYEPRFFVDIRLNHDVDLAKGEEIVLETLAKLPEKCPEIIGEPQYLGVVELPVRNAIIGKIDGITLRVAVTCLEENQEFLPYKIKRELVWVANQLLNDDTQTGIEDCKIVVPLDKAEPRQP